MLIDNTQEGIDEFSNIKPSIRASKKVIDLISDYVSDMDSVTFYDKDRSVWTQLPHTHTNILVDLSPLNKRGFINKYLEFTNKHLPEGGILVGKLETFSQHVHTRFKNDPKWLKNLKTLHLFLKHRVIPKLNMTKDIYFKYMNSNYRILTKAEALGRLASCGFDILEYKNIDGYTYFVAQKNGQPFFDEHPTYGLLVTLNRVGKGKKIIPFYKVRTMHPYAEYLQEYVFDKYGTENGDKINKDFRVTQWGKILRKLWLDELPMLYNLLKGDMKLVGVRPLSVHKFETYPKYLQDKRTKYKPGLVPPFYVDLPKTTEEFFACENKYLDEYAKKPIRTDIKYFFKAFYNIVIKRARSH